MLRLHVDVAFGTSPEWQVPVTAGKRSIAAWVWADDGEMQVEGKTAKITQMVARVLGSIGLAQLQAVFAEALEVQGGVTLWLEA